MRKVEICWAKDLKHLSLFNGICKSIKFNSATWEYSIYGLGESTYDYCLYLNFGEKYMEKYSISLYVDGADGNYAIKIRLLTNNDTSSENTYHSQAKAIKALNKLIKTVELNSIIEK